MQVSDVLLLVSSGFSIPWEMGHTSVFVVGENPSASPRAGCRAPTFISFFCRRETRITQRKHLDALPLQSTNGKAPEDSGASRLTRDVRHSVQLQYCPHYL